MLTLEAADPQRLPRADGRGPRVSGLDPLALVAVAVLVGLGELNLTATGGGGLAVHQLISVLGALALLPLLIRVRAASLPVIGRLTYAVALALLLAVLLRGRAAYGAQRWFSLWVFDVQPSELAKLGLLLMLANLLGGGRPGWRRAVLAMLAAAAPIALTLLQPDLSTSALLTILTLVLLLVARVPIVLMASLV